MSENSNLTEEQLATIKAAFPTDVPIKVFLLSAQQEMVQETLRGILRAEMVLPKSWNIKQSSGNKYKVITILTHLTSYELMVDLYGKIKEIEGVVQVM